MCGRLILLVTFSIFALTSAQSYDNQGVRLNSTLGSHAGRVEVKYYGQWGSICDVGWSSNDARVICRMLNLSSNYLCYMRGSPPAFGEGTGPVWLTNLRCRYYDEHLDECSNNRPQAASNPCSHDRDASVICQDPSVMPIPSNIRMINSTTRSILLRWNLNYIPPGLVAIQFGFNYTIESSSVYQYEVFRHSIGVTSPRQFEYVITGLLRNTSYHVRIRANGEYQWCSYNELMGNYSNSLCVTTNDTVPPSSISTRLVSSATTPHIGRFQVQHEGVWGNVCDDGFDMDDANLACISLNYTKGAICYGTRQFPQSTAPILLDDLNCRHADRIEDCSHRGWGIHNCVQGEAIGLVCNPGDNNIDVPVVLGLRVVNVAPNYITVAWNRMRNARRYRLYVTSPGVRDRSFSIRYTLTQYTVWGLSLGLNYTINITGAITFREFGGGNCYYQYVYGQPSQPIHVETKESAPTVRIKDFHVTVLNTTAVEVTWNPPSSLLGINGEIRGYTLIIQDRNSTNETRININTTQSRVYIHNGLLPETTYFFSILLHTVADGPHSVRLRVTMPNASNAPLISKFGQWGDGLEVNQGSTYGTGFNVLCGSSLSGITFDWTFANGSRIGSLNRGFRAAHFTNGTAVLQIGTASVSSRFLSVCDGGVYTCVATNSIGLTEKRNYTLTIGSSQPMIGAPRLLRRGSTWIQVGWDHLPCDGGYTLHSYTVQYRISGPFYYSYIRSEELTGLNYTIRDLRSNTEYEFRMFRKSTVTTFLRYSRTIAYTTLVEGPSPPMGIVATATCNSEVCIRWRSPALSVGTVVLYNLYAEPVANSEEASDSIDLPDSTIVKVFPGNLRSACVKLNVTGIIYHFQMSAVAIVEGLRVEGTLSPYSAETTLFLSKPGIQTPANLSGTASNTTITLTWTLPCLNNYNRFNVSYSGVVEWTSPTGAYSRFLEQGWIKTRSTSATFSYLTPSTDYVFSVAVVTDIETGPSATTTITTAKETGAKLVYFQIRILNIGECTDWVLSDVHGKLSDVIKSISTVLSLRCNYKPRISREEFSCRTGPNDTVVFRARVSGTESQSASDVATIIKDWVMTDTSSVTIRRVRHHLDPKCDSHLENMYSPDCENVIAKPSTTTFSAKSTSSPINQIPQSSKINADPTMTISIKVTTTTQAVGKTNSPIVIKGGGQGGNGGGSGAVVVGAVLGALILCLLITVIIILAFMLYQRKMEHSFQSQISFKQFDNNPGSQENVTDDRI